MIPEFTVDGVLPEGEFETDWDEFSSRYGWNSERKRLLEEIAGWLKHMKKAGCRSVYIGGSFITSKSRPGDFDACWDNTGVDANILDLDLLEYGSDDGRSIIRAKYGGDIRPDRATLMGSIQTFVEFMKADSRKSPPIQKGVIFLNLRTLVL